MNDRPHGLAPDPSDPVTALTRAEKAFVAQLNDTSCRDEVLRELKANLQTAVEIELATIPLYLYAYYSLVRNKESGEGMSEEPIFANKAGALIMSVAVEEMLHLSLSSNVLHALGGEPQLYGMAPQPYPTPLPYHRPKGPPGPDGLTAELFPLAGFGFEQLWHFLQVEYPEMRDALPEDRNWQTIGQFYSYIRCLLSTKFLTDEDFRQGDAARAIQPYNYSPNNIDTVYPSGNFDPWKPAPPVPTPAWAKGNHHPSGADAAMFTDSGDSHVGPTELIAVKSRRDAAIAIDTICDQGEGYPIGDEEDDDPSKDEHSHYVKFLQLQAQFPEYVGCKEKLPKRPRPPEPITPAFTAAQLVKAGVLVEFPDNPTNEGYPPELQPIAAFCSGLFQYMLIMIETIYRVPPEGQKLFFNEGLHRSMIWVLDKYAQTLRDLPVGGGKFMGPSFENISLGPRETSFAGLTALGNQAMAAATLISTNDPDGPWASYMSDVTYYIQVALTMTGSDDQPMHLPDVAPYWRDSAS
jgi:hypothetical protein